MTREKKKKEQKEAKLKKPAEASVEIGYVQEQHVENVSDLTVYTSDNTKKPYYGIRWCKGEENTDSYEELNEDMDIVNVYSKDTQYLRLFELSSMREKINNGESLQKVFGDLKNFILNNKDSNPDAIQYAIATLLDDAEEHYDNGTDNWLGISGYTRKHQGDSAEEILGKVLNTPENEEIDGFVCSTIHEFGMRLLDECGIKSTMIAGGTGGTNHTCLLWQRSDGKYVQTNYGKSYTLDATNMKDAAREVYKKDLGLINNGYIYLIDNSGSYQEFSMKEEAVWGDELDKRDYNNQSVFDHTIASQPSIQGKVNVSNLGAVSAEVTGTLAYGNDVFSKETSYSLGFKQSYATSMADNSKSVGFKLNHISEKKLDNGKKYSETKIVVDYTKLHTDEFTANQNYKQIIDHREFGDPEQVDRVRDWLEKEYDEYHNIDIYQNNKDWCNWYLEYFENNSQNINCPITKDEFIANEIQNYVSGDGVAYNDLSDFGKKNALKVIESHWENYLIDNLYNEAKDIVIAKLNYNQDQIDNYEKYKQESVDGMLARCLKINRSENDDNSTITIKSIDTTNLSLFLRKVFGRERTLLKDNGIELTNGYRLSGTVGLNDVLTRSKHNDTEEWQNGKLINEKHSVDKENVFTSFGGDIRLAAEEGLKLDIYDKTSLFSTAVSGGITADMSLKSGTLTPSVYTGLKLNGSTIFKTRPIENLTLGVGLNGYSVITKPSIDYGASGQLQASYKPNESNITIFGGVNYGIEKQRIRIGGFDEITEDSRNIGVTVGTQIGSKTTVNLNYNGKIDKLNSTRNRSVISVGARINL